MIGRNNSALKFDWYLDIFFCTKICKYFRRKTSCPFIEPGYKFSHAVHNVDKVVQEVVDKSVNTDENIKFEQWLKTRK